MKRIAAWWSIVFSSLLVVNTSMLVTALIAWFTANPGCNCPAQRLVLARVMMEDNRLIIYSSWATIFLAIVVLAAARFWRTHKPGFAISSATAALCYLAIVALPVQLPALLWCPVSRILPPLVRNYADILVAPLLSVAAGGLVIPFIIAPLVISARRKAATLRAMHVSEKLPGFNETPPAVAPEE